VTTQTPLENATTTDTNIITRRWLATPKKKKTKPRAVNGSRGSRGHGWYTKYREGRGGRHLQGAYWDRHTDDQPEPHRWNDAVLALGSQYVYFDVAVEPPASATAAAAAAAATSSNEDEIDIDITASSQVNESDYDDYEDAEVEAEKKAISELVKDLASNDEETKAEKTPPATTEAKKTKAKASTSAATEEEVPIVIERLVIQVASTVMPETCINLIGLLQEHAYKETILYRIEKEVGICGGDVLTNTGKTGQCWQSWPDTKANPNRTNLLRPSPLRRDLPPPSEEPMAMWHLAGTVAMLCAKVNEIDSRFILCAKDAPHMDGIHRAFGKLEPESLKIVQDWQSTILTSYGKPKSATLRIVDCGVLENYNSKSGSTTTTEASGPDQAGSSASATASSPSS